MRWDIFCKVIDNHGDIGVCWRLSAQLARRGQQVRLWLDDASALQWMAPTGCDGVQIIPWLEPVTAVPGDVVVEAFGCELDDSFMAGMAAQTRAQGRQPAWINLEYLSAEAYVERCHGLPSPVLSGPATGLTKRFFYPGFTPRTGGLLREQDLAARQAAFDREAWLRGRQIPLDRRRLLSLFCYEPASLPALLAQLAGGGVPARLLVTAGRAQAAVRAAMAAQDARQPGWNAKQTLAVSFLPLLSQHDFDHLLWACDLNFVRGEDSLVRALWAGKAFVWQLYPQEDGAHQPKLKAFLEWLAAPPSLRQVHEAWNGSAAVLPGLDIAPWHEAATQARARLLSQPDLAAQLLAAVSPALE